MRAASVAITVAASVAAASIAAPAAAQDPASERRSSAPAALDPWESAPLPWYAPHTLPYAEGMPLPPGYHVIRRRPRALLAAGAALLGGSYLASALTAATVIAGHARHRSEVAPLFAPLAGPWITLATSRDAALNDPDRRANGVFVMIDGVAQITGAALIVAGLVLREPVLVRTRESYKTTAALRVPEVLVGTRSASLRWRF